ncbi:hypothetical protein BABINDRAFT_163945, partial [Babjeviella inositovora NRRL Y-12698]
MGNTSSTPQPPKITAQDKAVLQLKIQRDRLIQYQQKLSLVTGRELQIAQELLRANNKSRALLALKKKKYQQSMLDKSYNQLATLEELIGNIEFKLVEKDFFAGLQTGSELLKQLNREVSLEKVEKIMDDTAEGIAYQEEVSEMLGSAINEQEAAEVEEELERMEREELAKQPAKVVLPEAPQNPLMPSVPSKVEERETGEKGRESSQAML